MRNLAIVLLTFCVACGAGENDCGAIRGQDCGAQMSVTMKYVAASGPCSVTETMSAEQFYWAVWLNYAVPTPLNGGNGCQVNEQSSSAATIDCGQAVAARLVGCNAAVCDWQPPVR